MKLRNLALLLFSGFATLAFSDLAAASGRKCSGANAAYKRDKPRRRICFTRPERDAYLRKEPAASGALVSVVPPNGRVRIYRRSGPIQTIDGRAGRWVRAKYDGKVGWLFGGDLMDRAHEYTHCDFWFVRCKPHEIRKPYCKGINNSWRCARQVERGRFPNPKGIFKRTRRYSYVYLLNKKRVRLPRHMGAHYALIDHMPRMNSIVLWQQFHEGGGFMLFNRLSGKKSLFYREPRVSPNRRILLTVSPCGDPEYCSNSFALFRILPGDIKLLYSRKIPVRHGYPKFVRWEAGQHPIIEIIHPRGGIVRRFIIKETKAGKMEKIRL